MLDHRLVLLWCILLGKSFEKSSFGGQSWSEASSFTNPLGKARIQAGDGVGCFPLQMLPERLDCRPELLWGKSHKMLAFQHNLSWELKLDMSNSTLGWQSQSKGYQKDVLILRELSQLYLRKCWIFPQYLSCAVLLLPCFQDLFQVEPYFKHLAF